MSGQDQVDVRIIGARPAVEQLVEVIEAGATVVETSGTIPVVDETTVTYATVDTALPPGELPDEPGS